MLGGGNAYRPEKYREYTPYISDCMIENFPYSVTQTSSARPGQQTCGFLFFYFDSRRYVSVPLGLFFRAAGVPCSAMPLIASPMADP